MRIHIASDLHLEHYKDQGMHKLEKWPYDSNAILILAGDVTQLKNSYWPEHIFEKFCAGYKHVLYTPGNHDHWRSRPDKALETIKLLESKYSNLTVFTTFGKKVIDNQRFLGGTMWFEQKPDNFMYKSLMNDFEMIERFEPWVYLQNEEFTRQITNELQKGDVVFTHYLPTSKSIDPIYRHDQTNRFYLHDMSNLIVEREPLFWFHGHTHCVNDYMAYNTRIYSNPHGYYGESKNPDFWNRMLIDISPDIKETTTHDQNKEEGS